MYGSVFAKFFIRQHTQLSKSSRCDNTIIELRTVPRPFTFCKTIDLLQSGVRTPENGEGLKCEFGRAFYAMHHIPTKLHHPVFNRSKVTVLTNKQKFGRKHPSRTAMLRRWRKTRVEYNALAVESANVIMMWLTRCNIQQGLAVVSIARDVGSSSTNRSSAIMHFLLRLLKKTMQRERL